MNGSDPSLLTILTILSGIIVTLIGGGVSYIQTRSMIKEGDRRAEIDEQRVELDKQYASVNAVQTIGSSALMLVQFMEDQVRRTASKNEILAKENGELKYEVLTEGLRRQKVIDAIERLHSDHARDFENLGLICSIFENVQGAILETLVLIEEDLTPQEVQQIQQDQYNQGVQG